MQEAPNHFAYDDNHCYVCRQPQTTAETTDMIGTAWMAEFQCIRYRGGDPDILRRLAELELRGICDLEPPARIKPVIRNHVQMAVAGKPTITTSQQLVGEFIDHLMSQNSAGRQFKTRPMQTLINASSLELSWFDDHFHRIVFAAVRDSPSDWHIESALNNDHTDRGVGNVIWSWLKRSKARFTSVRWYTDPDWRGSGVWQSTPW